MVQTFFTIMFMGIALAALAVLAQSLVDYREDIRRALTGRARTPVDVARIRIVGRPRRTRSVRLLAAAPPAPRCAAA